MRSTQLCYWFEGMAYYNDKREFFNGGLVLYKRDLNINSPKSKTHAEAKWYMRVKIDGRKGRAINKSTKCAVYEDAYAYALDEYHRLLNAHRLGHTLKEWTFEAHWNDWYERNKQANMWSESRADWHTKYFKRYFSAYFSDGEKSKLLNDIDATYAYGYFDWRIGYWSRLNGEQLTKYNPKRKSAKTKTTNNAVKVPSHKTLKMEQSALNQIFFDAFTKGRTQQAFKLQSPKMEATLNGQRAFFTDDEYNKLVRNLKSYKDNVGRFKGVRVNAKHALERQQMYYFILFLANSGLRVGEARLMKWSDITFDIKLKNSNEMIAEVRVSQHNKTKKERFVQCQPNANRHLKEWRKITKFNKSDDLVWFSIGANGTQRPFTDLNKTFQTILKKIPHNDRADGLLFSADGQRRSLYSLRHVYVTMRLNRGVSIYDVSKNIGSQVKQIEKHYSHMMTKDRAEQITKVPTRSSDNDKVDDDFVAEALARFKDGKLSQTALMEILNNK